MAKDWRVWAFHVSVVAGHRERAPFIALLRLVDVVDSDGRAIVSVDHMAKLCGCSVHEFIPALEFLETLGVIEAANATVEHNDYIVVQLIDASATEPPLEGSLRLEGRLRHVG